jgi:hypothetical protein
MLACLSKSLVYERHPSSRTKYALKTLSGGYK